VSPDQNSSIPTLLAWAGGPDALKAMTDRFYAKVPQDPVLGPIFAGMNPAHASHVADFIAEVIGNIEPYSARGGSHAGMITRHLNRHLTDAQRRHWMALLLETADEIGLPDDPEFRSAFVGYLEWGSRLAVINSAPGVEPPEPGMPMPKWDWGPPGGPYIPKAE